MRIIKKDTSLAPYDFSKIKNAVTKSCDRVNVKFTDEDWESLRSIVEEERKKSNLENIPVIKRHTYVELALDQVNPGVAKS